MNIFDKAFGIHPAALTFRSERGSVLASNIANSATPDYQARDYDFRTALQKYTAGQTVGLQATNSSHIKSASTNQYGDLLYRIPTRAASNNNTVEADVEQAAFSDNALRYQTTLQFLNGSIMGLRKAISGRI